MGALDIDLLAIESPFEYQEWKTQFEIIDELKRLIVLCNQKQIPVKAFSDILREPGQWDEWLTDQLGFSLEYIKIPDEQGKENDDWQEPLLKLLEHTNKPNILLTGGYIRYFQEKDIPDEIYRIVKPEQLTNIDPQNKTKPYALIEACVGDRAGNLFEFLKLNGKISNIYIDPKSAVLDPYNTPKIDMDSLYLVHSSYFHKLIEIVRPLVKPQKKFRYVLTQKVPRSSIIY